ncbi:MAG: hypothetical protein ACE5M4_06085 [Anaerolineales bacterium]
MDLIEFNTHSFIVKIWLEEPAEDHHKGRWRGHITHVPSGERRYLKSLGGIVAFIVPYLVSMGVRLEAYWSLRYLLWRGRGTQLPDSEQGSDGEGGLRSRGVIPDPSGGRPAEQ